MEVRDRLQEAFTKQKGELLAFAVLLGFGFWINRGVKLEGLYMDDLYLWSCYGEQSFREFVFPAGGTRFRFVFYLAAWLEMLLLGNHVTWMVPFNIGFNAAIAFTLYRMSVRLTGGRRFVSLALGLAYLLSRLSYYQIGQFYGLMESLGLWLAVGFLYTLYLYVNEGKTLRYFGACLLYFLASFVHERYMALLPVLLLALALGGRSARPALPEKAEEERIRVRGQSRRQKTGGARRRTAQKEQPGRAACLALALLVFGLILLIRKTMIGTLSPAGTGGTDVADTFVLSEAIGHAWEQVGFVFGRNFGPDYLCGLTFADSPENIKNLVLAAEAVLGIMTAGFVVCLFWRERENLVLHLKNAALFFAFFALCIGSSSVTIRVEMRWVYVVYAAALLWLAYMTRVLGKLSALVFLYAALLFPAENFYRGCWENLYFWPQQNRYNSLAEETVGRYGDAIFEKDVYIIGNTYEMSDFTAETFLKVYDRENRPDGKSICFIDSDFDFRELADDAVILCEDTEHDAYRDVTDFVKKQRFNRAYGSYDDGWVDQNSKIVFLTGKTDRVILNCYYPGKIDGTQVCKVRVNGDSLPDLVFTDQSMSYEFEAAPYQMISLELSCNFYVRNAKETRGEEKLAMIVDIVGRD